MWTWFLLRLWSSMDKRTKRTEGQKDLHLSSVERVQIVRSCRGSKIMQLISLLQGSFVFFFLSATVWNVLFQSSVAYSGTYIPAMVTISIFKNQSVDLLHQNLSFWFVFIQNSTKVRLTSFFEYHIWRLSICNWFLAWCKRVWPRFSWIPRC